MSKTLIKIFLLSVLLIVIILGLTLIFVAFEIREEDKRNKDFKKLIKKIGTETGIKTKELEVLVKSIEGENETHKGELEKISQGFEELTKKLTNQVEVMDEKLKELKRLREEKKNYEFNDANNEKSSNDKSNGDMSLSLIKKLNPQKYEIIQAKLDFVKQKRMNIRNPKYFIEKLNWLICFDNIPLKTIVTDKLLMCEYSNKIIGKNICVPKLKVYKDVNEIDYFELPDQFVLRANHVSGDDRAEIVSDKYSKNIELVRNNMKKVLNTNFAKVNNEPHYIGIEPKLFAEKYIDPKTDEYKFFCFNGKLKFFSIHSGKGTSNLIVNTYDINNDFTSLNFKTFKSNKNRLDKMPENIETMKEYVTKLSKPFFFVRVDLWNINGEIYLKELCFTPHGGNLDFGTDDTFVGEMLDLSKRPENINDYDFDQLIDFPEETELKVPLSNFK